ncbi:MAG: CoA-transferase [Bauldia sp.]|uniref:CoA-transferase n=1 Tax=Bauldia sp. TaxID=2575872 RepID=UPI001DB7DB28|nr:CoA-transferase [Bauldia sp.]MCB1495090.1 CoA-transferase [Bauldia sp.]
MDAALHQSLVKPNRPIFTDLAGLAAMVADGDVFGVGGHHFARLPVALLNAVAARGVGGLRYVSWAGGLPLEMLLEAEAVASIDLCFSSLDIFGLPPRFRAVAEAGAVPVSDWTALGMIQALRAAEQNLPSLPFQLPEGSDMMARMPGAATVDDPASGEAVGVVPPLRLDTVVLHAPRADALGNVAIVGARALDWPMAAAARKVLVTVEEIVPAGEIARDDRHMVLTRNRVTAIARVEGGAWPASCLPRYVTDYAALNAAFASGAPLAETLRLPAAGVPPTLRTAAHLPAAGAAGRRFPTVINRGNPAATTDEAMAIRIAAELDNDSFASAGAVSPLANVAYRLAKATHAPDMFVATMTCGHLDITPSPLSLSLIEPFDAETAAAHAGGDDTYSAYYQGGAVTHEIIAAAQVDARARVNNIAIARKDGGTIRLPGQGGMADVANMHGNYVIYVTRHAPLSLVAAVDIASCGRAYLTPEEREARGYRPGAVKLITDLCVFELDEVSRELVVTEMFPGVTRDQVAGATGFPAVFAADCCEVPPPGPEILEVLRERIDPLGLRRLEFVGSRQRGGLLDEVIALDRELVAFLADGVETERKAG